MYLDIWMFGHFGAVTAGLLFGWIINTVNVCLCVVAMMLTLDPVGPQTFGTASPWGLLTTWGN